MKGHSSRKFFDATRFFRFDNGRYHVDLCFFFLCALSTKYIISFLTLALGSVNSTLQVLILGSLFGGGNLIGDKGAAALADALMYVTIAPPEISLHFIHFVSDNGPYHVVSVSDLQPKQHVDGIEPHIQRNW